MAGMLALAHTLAAQTKKLPSFDVVSVRVDDTGGRGFGIDVEKNSFTATNVTLMNLIAEAYGMKSDLVSGAPGWADSVRYDVKAKVLDANGVDLESLSDRERGPILQELLVERFHLKVHEETKTLPVYELEQTKSGSKLKPSAVVEGGESMPQDGNYTVGRGRLNGHGMTMASLTYFLTEVVRRKVVDKSGLTGHYDIELLWTPDEDANKEAAMPESAPPPVFTAVQEQLGLRLQSGKGPVQTLVIDHVEKPSEN